MVKAFTAEELALLEMKPSDLDPIKKKERERLKARQYMAKNRAKQRTEMGNEAYKAMRVQKMQVYRDSKKTEYLEAVKENTTDPKEQVIITKTIKKIKEQPTRQPSNRVKVPTDKRIINPIVITKEQDNELKDIVPEWKTALMKEHPNYKINSKEYMKRAGLTKKALPKNLTIIEGVMKKVFKYEIPQDLKAVITFIFRGNNIEHLADKNHINIFKSKLDKYFHKSKIYKTITDISNHYYENAISESAGRNTLKGKMVALANLFSRVDSYHDTYQPLTKLANILDKEYFHKSKDNTIDPKDKDKLIALRDNYDIDNVSNNKKLIENNNLTTEEKALASMYLLQPPRRNETGSLRLTSTGITEKDEKLLQKGNYIVMDGDEPVKQIYGDFKTATKTIGRVEKEIMGVQSLPIMPEVAKYLKQHIIENKLKLGQYIFGSHTYTTENLNMNKKITEAMFKIFKLEGISSKVLRQGASMFNQQSNRSQNEKEIFAEAMGHSETVQKAIYNKVNLDDVPDEEDKRMKQVKKGNKIPLEKKQQATDVKNKPKVQLKAVEKVGNVRRSSRKKKK